MYTKAMQRLCTLYQHFVEVELVLNDPKINMSLRVVSKEQRDYLLKEMNEITGGESLETIKDMVEFHIAHPL